MVRLSRPTPSTFISRGWLTGHRGIDYGHNYTEKSMEILASVAGRVLDVYTGSGYNGGWGRRIRIDHGAGVITTYNHIRPGGVLVSPGQQVQAGELIGRMGSSGASTGTHLHFELYLNGVRVDPAPYFDRDLPGIGEASSSGGGAPSSGQQFAVPAGGQYYYWNYNNALTGNYAPSQLLRGGQLLDVVENPGTGPVRVRCADGDLVWVGTRNNPAAVVGGQSADWYFDVPAGGQYYYWHLANALEGDYSASQLLSGNQRLVVVENSGQGPVRVRAKDGDLVWVGTRRNPAAIHR